MNALTRDVIATALADMFRRGHFSICVIDNILKITGGVPDRKNYDLLRALHCVEFKDMPPRIRIELPRMIQLVVEGQPIVYPPPTLPDYEEMKQLSV